MARTTCSLGNPISMISRITDSSCAPVANTLAGPGPPRRVRPPPASPSVYPMGQYLLFPPRGGAILPRLYPQQTSNPNPELASVAAMDCYHRADPRAFNAGSENGIIPRINSPLPSLQRRPWAAASMSVGMSCATCGAAGAGAGAGAVGSTAAADGGAGGGAGRRGERGLRISTIQVSAGGARGCLQKSPLTGLGRCGPNWVEF